MSILRIKRGTSYTTSSLLYGELYLDENKDKITYLNNSGSGFNTIQILESQIINTTYSQLSSSLSNGLLIPGQKYKITDYQTTYNMPEVTPTLLASGSIEPLIVTAMTSSSLESIAFSEQYPQDLIYYDIINNQTIIPGCNKGYIYRRIDTKQNNDICFDFRQVKFRRWKINITEEHADGNAAYTKRTVIKKTNSNDIYVKLTNATGSFDSYIYPNIENPSTNSSTYWDKISKNYITHPNHLNGVYCSWSSSNLSVGNLTFSVDSADYIDMYMFSKFSDYSLHYTQDIINNTFNTPSTDIIKNSNVVFIHDYSNISNNVFYFRSKNFINNNNTIITPVSYGGSNGFVSDFYNNICKIKSCLILYTNYDNKIISSASIISNCSFNDININYSTLKNVSLSNITGSTLAYVLNGYLVNGKVYGIHFYLNALKDIILTSDSYIKLNNINFNNINTSSIAELYNEDLYKSFLKFVILTKSGTLKYYYHDDTTFAPVYKDITE